MDGWIFNCLAYISLLSEENVAVPMKTVWENKDFHVFLNMMYAVYGYAFCCGEAQRSDGYLPST